MHGAGAGANACSLLVQEEVRLEVDLIVFAIDLICLQRAAVSTAGALARRVMRAHVSGAPPLPKLDDHLLGRKMTACTP